MSEPVRNPGAAGAHASRLAAEGRCTCAACWPFYPHFRVCPECGNKRCPKAASHERACTNSNEPGQKGSLYED